MKALVKSRREPGIWMEDIPEPGVGHNDVLVRVRKAAICGTDLHIYNWDAWAQRPSRCRWRSVMSSVVRSSRSAAK